MFGARRTTFLLLSACAVFAFAASPSLAVVGGLTDFSLMSNPSSEYYGLKPSYIYTTRSGTSVSIGYFTLLTADHYAINTVDDTSAGYDTYVINGDTWRVTTAERLTADLSQTAKPDMRILHMENLTNPYRPLPGHYDIYTNTNFPTRNVVMVGTGDTGSTANLQYYTDTGDRQLRWGTNRVDTFTREAFTDAFGINHSTYCLELAYNRVASQNPTTYECGLGDHDSGSGFFINDNGKWKLAGMGLYRQYYSNYTDRYQGFAAVDLAYYATRLNSVLQYDLLPGDLNLDGDVDAYDYITLKKNLGMTSASWRDGDFNHDGIVGSDDLSAVITNMGFTSDPHPIMTPPVGGGGSSGGVPEPGTMLLLSLGSAALLRRRKAGLAR